MADMDQKDRCSCMHKAGIAGYYAPRAVFPSLVGRPHMLSILAGTEQKYSCSGMCKAGFSGVSASRAVLPEVYRKIGFWEMTWYSSSPLVSGSHLFELLPEEYRVAFLLEMSPGMVSVFSTPLGSTADTCSASVYEACLEEFHAFLREGRILRSILVLMTAENCGVSAVAVHRCRRHLCHGAQADSHGR